MGGDVGGESMFGVGSIFWFSVCLKKGVLNMFSVDYFIFNVVESCLKQDFFGKCVLLVEDELVNCEVMQEMLVDIDWVVDCVEDGVEVVKLVG